MRPNTSGTPASEWKVYEAGLHIWVIARRTSAGWETKPEEYSSKGSAKKALQEMHK